MQLHLLQRPYLRSCLRKCRCRCREPREVDDCDCICHVSDDSEDGAWSDSECEEGGIDPDCDEGWGGSRLEEDATSVVSGSDDSECECECDASDDMLVDNEDAVDPLIGHGEQQLDRETILKMFSCSQDAWHEIEDLYDDSVLEPEIQPFLTMRTNPWCLDA